MDALPGLRPLRQVVAEAVNALGGHAPIAVIDEQVMHRATASEFLEWAQQGRRQLIRNVLRSKRGGEPMALRGATEYRTPPMFEPDDYLAVVRGHCVRGHANVAAARLWAARAFEHHGVEIDVDAILVELAA